MIRPTTFATISLEGSKRSLTLELEGGHIDVRAVVMRENFFFFMGTLIPDAVFCAAQLAWQLSAQSERPGGVVYKYTPGMPAMGKFILVHPHDPRVRARRQRRRQTCHRGDSHFSQLEPVGTSAGYEGLVC